MPNNSNAAIVGDAPIKCWVCNSLPAEVELDGRKLCEDCRSEILAQEAERKLAGDP